MVSLPGRCDGHPAGSVGACQISANSACNIGEAVAPNAIMGWTVFQPRREQWTRQRYQLAPPESLRSRPQLENGHPAGSVGACQISADSACNIGEAVAPNAIMGWTVFQPRREQWTRQRYQLAPPESLRSRPQLENSGPGSDIRACAAARNFASTTALHNAASTGCRHYLFCRIDNRAALKVRRTVSATASA